MPLSWDDHEWLAAQMQVIHGRLDNLFRIMRNLQQMELQTMTDLSDLQAAVDEDVTVDQSAITLISGLADQIEALSTDPAALAALAAQMRSTSADLAAAVSAHTPAAPDA